MLLKPTTSVPSLLVHFRFLASKRVQVKNIAAEDTAFDHRASKFVNFDDGRHPELDVRQLEEAASKIIKSLESESKRLQIGRASPNLIESLRVTVEGRSEPLADIASISTQDYQRLLVTPFSPDASKAIITAISSAGLNLLPVQDGPDKIMVTFPRATNELCESIMKMVASSAEVTKKRLRFLRQKVMDDLKVEIKDLDVRRQSERLLTLQLDKFGTIIDKIVQDKQRDLQKAC